MILVSVNSQDYLWAHRTRFYYSIDTRIMPLLALDGHISAMRKCCVFKLGQGWFVLLSICSQTCREIDSKLLQILGPLILPTSNNHASRRVWRCSTFGKLETIFKAFFSKITVISCTLYLSLLLSHRNYWFLKTSVHPLTAWPSICPCNFTVNLSIYLHVQICVSVIHFFPNSQHIPFYNLLQQSHRIISHNRWVFCMCYS